MLDEHCGHVLAELGRIGLGKLRLPYHPGLAFLAGPCRAQQVLELLGTFHSAAEELVISTCTTALATTTNACP